MVCIFFYLNYNKFPFLHANAVQALNTSNLVDKCFFSFPLDDFKPASIDTSCEGELQVGKGDEVTITLPHTLQYSCLENPMDGGSWWAAVHGVARVGHD